jgi:ATPase subunit of ABC transporter with duplicated ATPase domains
LTACRVSLQGLALFRGGVLMVSHDQHLIESTVDELWAVEQGTGAAATAPLRSLHKSVERRR